MNDSQLDVSENDALVWFLDRAENLNIKFELNSTLVHSCGLYLYGCHLSSLGKIAKGYGCDNNRRRAQLKSAMEALERRLVVELNWLHSSGTSLHPNPREAEEKAVCEALERDAFFSHFYTQTPFSFLSDSSLEEEWNIRLSSMGLRGSLRRLHSHRDLHVIVACLSDDRNVHICLGLGCDRDERKAKLHAQSESLSFYSYLSSSKAPATFDLKTFQERENITVFDHGHLGKDKDYAAWFWATYINRESNYRSSLEDLPQANPVPLPDPLSSAPFSLFRADQSNLQEPSWGRYDQKNLRRLKEFCGKELSEIVFPSYPHCFT